MNINVITYLNWKMANFVHNQIIEQNFINQVELRILLKYHILDILQKYGHVKILINGDHPIQIGIILIENKNLHEQRNRIFWLFTFIL
jgi:hypothetical protein